MIHEEKCPICEKGRLKKIQDKIMQGIYVEAFKCNKCSEIFYSEKIIKKIEAIKRADSQTRKIVKIGNSYAAIIPSEIIKKLAIKEKETVYVREKKGRIIIMPKVK